MLKDLLAKDGYVFLREYMSTKTTHDLLRHLKEQENFDAISDIHCLTPKTKSESTPNTYSGQYGYGEFPMHTDLAHWPTPPRYLLLRCIQGSNQIATTLLDGNKIINSLGRRELERALIKPRRPLKGELRLMRLFHSGPPSLIRWDSTFIAPASPTGVTGLEAMRSKINEMEKDTIFMTEKSDTLLIDNWRVLHGRSTIPPNINNRIIERVYLGESTWV